MRIFPFIGWTKTKTGLKPLSDKPLLYQCSVGEKYKGTVGLLDVDKIGRNIFMHERLLDEKLNKYVRSFQSTKMQFTPIVVASDKNCTVLDGHHRLAAARSLGLKWVSAFVMTAGWESHPVFRKYPDASVALRRNFWVWLVQNFSLEQVEGVFDPKHFHVGLDGQIWKILDYGDRKILEWLDAYAVASGFENHKWENCQPYTALWIVIPPYNLQSVNKAVVPLLPPHSTYFTPKFPKELVIYKF